MAKATPNPPVPIADCEVNSATPRPGGFILNAQGRDGSGYELSLKLDVPMNDQTQLALGEMLAQSSFRLSRVQNAPSLKTGARKIRTPARPPES